MSEEGLLAAPGTLGHGRKPVAGPRVLPAHWGSSPTSPLGLNSATCAWVEGGGTQVL